MLDFLFTQGTIISIVIAGFLGAGFGTLLLQRTAKIPLFGPRPRKWLARGLALGFVLCGIIFFFLTTISVFYSHQAHFNPWITDFALSTIICTIIFTFMAYIITSIMLGRLNSLRG
jgi:hypothetical protein